VALKKKKFVISTLAFLVLLSVAIVFFLRSPYPNKYRFYSGDRITGTFAMTVSGIEYNPVEVFDPRFKTGLKVLLHVFFRDSNMMKAVFLGGVLTDFSYSCGVLLRGQIFSFFINLKPNLIDFSLNSLICFHFQLPPLVKRFQRRDNHLKCL